MASRPPSQWWSDSHYLGHVDRFEQVVAKLLGLMLILLIILASLEMFRQLAVSLLRNDSIWAGDVLFRLFGDLLNILIGLELLQNITAYLKRHAVQIQLVLLTAITAVARKLIVLPGSADSKPLMVVSLGLCVLALAAAYWLMRNVSVRQDPSRTGPARSFPGRNQWPPPDGDDGP